MIESGETVLEITHGHSKDHRPDLVQVGLQLIVENKSGIPLLMKVLSGNAEESKSYGDTIKTHVENLQNNYGQLPFIGDSKLYTSDNLQHLSKHENLHWITRVPATLLKDFPKYLHRGSFTTLPSDPNYSFLEIGSNYGGVNQKWVVFLSQTLRKTQENQLEKKYKKALIQDQKTLEKVMRQKFHCPSDARQELSKYEKSLRYSLLHGIEIVTKHRYAKRGKPTKNDQPIETYYKIEAVIVPNKKAYEQAKENTGYFVLASNDLIISAQEILATYKNQASVEKSFRFLKDPEIVASSLFVQKPERIRALLCIMTLCLLVYATLEYKIRYELKKKEQTFDNQLGKPIENPTLWWIFLCFEGIEVLYQQEQENVKKWKKIAVLNLKPMHWQVLALLGDKYQDFYT